MQTKTIIWIVAGLAVLALLIWGISSLMGGGDDSGTSAGEEGDLTGGEQDEGVNLIDDSLIGDTDSIELGDVI